MSVPWCHYPTVWEWFGAWKHRRPGEHLWHWSERTLPALFGVVGYRLVLHGCPEDAIRRPDDPTEPNVLTALFVRG